MDSLHQHKTTQTPNMPLVLQEANDLLALLADDAIWLQLTHGGLRSDARAGLASALDATRCSYSRCRSEAECTQHLEPSHIAALDAAMASRGRALADLDRSMGAIRHAGCLCFHDTASLQRRFTTTHH